MAAAFQTKSEVVGIGTVPTGTEPTSTVQDDVLWMLYAVETGIGVPALPAGWTSWASGVSPSNFFRIAVGYIVRGASAPSYVCGGQTASGYRELHVMRISGCDTATPISAASVNGGFGTATANPDAPSTSPATATDLAMAIGIQWTGSGGTGFGAPAGYTIRSRNTAGDDCVIATKAPAATPTENPAAFTGGSGTSDVWAATVLFTSAGAGGAVILPQILVVPNMAVVRGSYY